MNTNLSDANILHNPALKKEGRAIAYKILYPSLDSDFSEFKDMQDPISIIAYSITFMFGEMRLSSSLVLPGQNGKKKFETYLKKEENFKTFIKEIVKNEADYNTIITQLETAKTSFQEHYQSIENTESQSEQVNKKNDKNGSFFSLKNVLLITTFSIILIETFIIIGLYKKNLALQSTLKLCQVLITQLAKNTSK